MKAPSAPITRPNTDTGYRFCPRCGQELAYNEKTAAQGCTVCPFVHWDNPIPTVASLVAFPASCIGRDDISGLVFPDLVMPNPAESGILLIQRRNPPFQDCWALPGGFVDNGFDPEAAAMQETLQEAGIISVIRGFLFHGKVRGINMLATHYVAIPVAGRLEAGDDAKGVGIFSPNDMPEICFPTHQIAIARWLRGEIRALWDDET